MLTIIGTEFNAAHDALEVYVSGCKQHCPGCHNPEAQVFGRGKSSQLWLKESRYKFRTGTFSRVWILGGDLLAQPEPDAVEFLTSLRRSMPLHMQLWLFTGSVENLEDVPHTLRDFFDVIKTGAYRADLPPVDVFYDETPGGTAQRLTLASNNQQLHDLRKEALL